MHTSHLQSSQWPHSSLDAVTVIPLYVQETGVSSQRLDPDPARPPSNHSSSSGDGEGAPWPATSLTNHPSVKRDDPPCVTRTQHLVVRSAESPTAASFSHFFSKYPHKTYHSSLIVIHRVSRYNGDYKEGFTTHKSGLSDSGETYFCLGFIKVDLIYNISHFLLWFCEIIHRIHHSLKRIHQ